MKQARVQTGDFDVSAELAALRAREPRIGAVVSFVGTVRDMNDGASVSAMELEHYPGMTEQALEQIIAQARQRWPLLGALVVHRVGPLKPLEQIVLVACASAHRGEAFDACEFIIDYLKTEAPFWKKEQTPEGARWVDARESDENARAKWGDSLSWLAVGLGAAAGAWLRWGLSLWLAGVHGKLGIGTLVANLGGGYLIGLLLGVFASLPHLSPEWRLFAITGFLGGLTTFSTFSAEAMVLLQRGDYGWAAAHSLLHLAGSVGCCIAGFATWRYLSQ